MLAFFRKIRLKLAFENKPLKYFRYAVGEIFLVVIGILIALSINNWNNSRIKNNNAIALSKRLLVETKKNKKQLEYQMNRVKELQEETKSLLNMFGPDYKEKSSKLLDSLLYGLISTPLYEFNESTLTEGLNTGQISSLPSDSLRTLLYDIPRRMIRINNYEEEMTRDIENNIMHFLYNEISLRQVDERFSDKLKPNEESRLKRFDNRVILTMKKFENMVDNKYFLLQTLQYGYDDMFVILNKTIDKIEESLASKEMDDD